MNNAHLTTRIATIEDIPGLVEVINRAYVAEAPFVHGVRTDRIDLQQRIATPNTWFLVVELEIDFERSSRLAGCVCLDCDGQRGHIGLLSVDPDYQRRGLGAKLLRAAEALCQTKMCCPEIELEVVSLREDLFPFYTHLGYERVGTSPFPVQSRLKQPAHLVVMRRKQ